jgi:hypothetical protein
MLVAVAALVFGGACLGLAVSGLIGRTSAIWVANAILVYFLLKNPRTDWLAILFFGLAGNFAADLAMGDDIVAAIALTACNAAGVVILAAPLEHFGPSHYAFSTRSRSAPRRWPPVFSPRHISTKPRAGISSRPRSIGTLQTLLATALLCRC